MFDHLKYVKAVSDCKSFVKAADRLCITQPALSIAISKAEEELGAKLFDRSVKPLKLTDAGRLYIESAQKVLQIENELKENLGEKTVKGEISIGAAGIAMNYILPRILKEYRKKYPEVKTVLFEESAFTLKDSLKNGSINLLLDTEITDEEVISVPLFTNTVFYAVAQSLLSKELIASSYSAQEVASRTFESDFKGRIGFERLCHLPYLSLQPRNELYAKAELYFAHYHLRPKSVMHFNQQLTAYRFAENGFGGTFAGDTLIRERPAGSLRFFLMDVQLPERRVCLCYRKSGYLNRAMRSFIDTAVDIYGRV